MGDTSGVILPSSFESQKALEEELRRRDNEAGYTPLSFEDFRHSSISNFNDFLEHYGKKGMKWGVRKAPVKTSSDYKKTSNLRRKNPKSLTNKQIQAVNARIKLEKSYKQNNPHPIAKGLKVAGAIVSAVGTATAVYNLRNNPILKDAVSTGSKLALKMVRESKDVPFEQLKLF